MDTWVVNDLVSRSVGYIKYFGYMETGGKQAMIMWHGLSQSKDRYEW
jgi:hypothetical protein